DLLGAFGRLRRNGSRRRRGPKPLLLAAEEPSLAASQPDLGPRHHGERRGIGVTVLGIVNLAGPGGGRARSEPAEDGETDNRAAAHRGILVADIVQGLAL